MSNLASVSDRELKLIRLLSYIDHDPHNLSLIADACTLALDVGQPEKAGTLLSEYEAAMPLPPVLLNLKGLTALQQARYEEAADVFEQLFAETPNNTSLRFNLAWSKAMCGDDVQSLAVLDDPTTLTIPGAAVLKVETLHRLGELDGALSEGTRLAEKRTEDSALAGALSLVAIDLAMPDLARSWAAKAQNTAEGLSTMGVLVLQDNHIDEALTYFDKGLAIRPDSARNLLGKGLALMAAGDATGAVNYIEQSAGIFKKHLGTWIAAGWAHFAAGDKAKARAVFEHALGLDDTFSESHGALAVLDILDGDLQNARRRTETALRLDWRCFAGTLAQSLLMEKAGDVTGAQRVRDIALNTPLESGRTLAQAMIDIAPNWRKSGKG